MAPSMIVSPETHVKVITDDTQMTLTSTESSNNVVQTPKCSVSDEKVTFNDTVMEVKESPPSSGHKLTIQIPADQTKSSSAMKIQETITEISSDKNKPPPSTSVQITSEDDRSKLSYAQILGLGLRAAPAAAGSHTYGALKSIVSYVTGPAQAETKPSTSVITTPTAIKAENLMGKASEVKVEEKIPEVRVEVSSAPQERKHSGSRDRYIPGLLFKDDRRARTRSRSSRRKKADQEENTKEAVEMESTEEVKESKKVTDDLTVKEIKTKNTNIIEKASNKISTDISTEQKNEKLEKESKTVDDVANSAKNEEKRKKKKVNKYNPKD